jgi:hypothetical protein
MGITDDSNMVSAVDAKNRAIDKNINSTEVNSRHGGLNYLISQYKV